MKWIKFMKIHSNHQYLNEISNTRFATKYPQLVSIALAYVLLHKRTKYLMFDFYIWFPWRNTKEGYTYWAHIANTI